MKINDIPRLARIGATLVFLMYVAYHLTKDSLLMEELVTLTAEGDFDDSNVGETNQIILDALKRDPDRTYIAPSGRSLFRMMLGANGTPLLLSVTGPNFNKMSPIEIDNYIHEKLEDEFNGR